MASCDAARLQKNPTLCLPQTTIYLFLHSRVPPSLSTFAFPPYSALATMSKNEVIELHTPHDGRDSPMDEGEGIKTGTNADAADMHRMGRVQEFKRNFRSFSILGLSSVIMATWVALLGSASFSLINGGYAGTIWVYVGVWVSWAETAELDRLTDRGYSASPSP